MLQKLHDSAHDVLREVLKDKLKVVPEEHFHYCEAPSQNFGILLQVIKVLAADGAEVSHS